MKRLHIIKKANDTVAHEMIARQRAQSDDEILVLLLQDSVYTPPKDFDTLYVCRDDLEARNLTSAGTVLGYEEIVTLLLEADTVINW